MNNGEEYLAIPVAFTGLVLTWLSGMCLAMAVCGDSGVDDE